jgi:hypothetical protein
LAIEVTRVVEPVPFAGTGVFNTIVMVCLCLTIIGIPLAVAYALILKIFIIRQNGQIQNQFIVGGVELFRKFIGQDVEHINVGVDISTNMFSLSGIAYKGGYFYLMSMGSATKVQFDKIRDYSWSIDGVTNHTIVGAGLLYGSALVEQSLNEASAIQAYKNSGLSVSVKDVSHPTWFIMTDNKSLCEKWAEIFKQVEAGTM